jgi:hypothetical protein
MVLLPKDIDVSQINVSKPNVLDNGAKLIYVNYTGEKKFRIQTPKMSLPFGLNEYTEGPYPKYSTELSYKESPSTDPKEIKNNEKIKQFHDKMIEIEAKLIDLAVENSGPWFKLKNANRDIISSKFLPPIVKVSKDKDGEPDGKYPPTSKLKIYNKDGKWGCSLFDMKPPNSIININSDEGLDIKDVITNNARIKGIISCVGIWIGSGTFMCQWALSEARVEVPEGRSSNQSFVPDSDDEEEDEEEGEADEEQTTPLVDEPVEQKPTLLDDSDEEEAEVEAAAEPDPEPVKKPKKVLKKKVKA